MTDLTKLTIAEAREGLQQERIYGAGTDGGLY